MKKENKGSLLPVKDDSVDEWFTLKDLSDITGYSSDTIQNHIIPELNFSSTNFVGAHSKLGGYHNTQKFYNIKVLEAIKSYQLSAHGNTKNADVQNESTDAITSFYKENRGTLLPIDNDNKQWFTIEEVAQMTGYTKDSLTNGKNGILYKQSFVHLIEAHSKLGGYHNTQKFYDIKVIEAIKAYQLSAHGNTKNADVQNETTMQIIHNAKQMVDLQVIAESGNVEAMQQFMSRMVAYTQSVNDAKEAAVRAKNGRTET